MGAGETDSGGEAREGVALSEEHHRPVAGRADLERRFGLRALEEGLLIYHPYSGRGRKRELAARHAAVHPDVPQDHRPLLAGRFRDIEASYEPVVPSDPDR